MSVTCTVTVTVTAVVIADAAPCAPLAPLAYPPMRQHLVCVHLQEFEMEIKLISRLVTPSVKFLQCFFFYVYVAAI